ncbi:hypothetical protein WMY93_019019 [Mugilogobius chulae]|uniref:Uncharacterized protein n=1 Tax=Mugilogobius chulae TaxID=88201 RepID=A0AAW0NPZ4_9GOBI
MCRVPEQLRESVKRRLAAAGRDFELLEKTIAEYEEQNERQRTLLDQLLQSRGGKVEPLLQCKEEP